MKKVGEPKMGVRLERKGPILTVILDRPEVRNAVDAETAGHLADAFREFEADEDLAAAVLWGAGGTFCAGADLKALAEGRADESRRLSENMADDGPMGPTRMRFTKPVIAAVSGYAVAGGLELACLCDLRVAERDAVFGVFCRRFGVPLIDGGTQRLPRLIGMSRALDMILTGRPVGAEEALAMGLANRVVEHGHSRREAEKLAEQISAFPRFCMKSDREAVYRGFDLPLEEALSLEFKLGMQVIESGESRAGARRFKGGEGKGGCF
jgi:enoyl-CoA hydratase